MVSIVLTLFQESGSELVLSLDSRLSYIWAVVDRLEDAPFSQWAVACSWYISFQAVVSPKFSMISPLNAHCQRILSTCC